MVDSLLKACRYQALRFLARRDHSVFELTKKLESRDYSDDEINTAIASLAASGYINDKDYCDRYAKGRKMRNNLGPRRVDADLRRKGFAPALIKSALETLYGQEGEEIVRAMAAAKKKSLSFSSDSKKEVMKKKLFDHLLRRGFSIEVARLVALDRFDECLEHNRQDNG